ncbi:phage tail protein [Aerosakkonemataceae cyanobacterium BLCC-F154]|uniref:Phage tail protein n=1 Tax=Floridaenema fluviatile BLCC-F154 TaxID=3153640 RepID=A0ABV4YJI6_9CYAN
MTQVLCDLYDSSGQPLNGAIRVTLDYSVGNQGTGKMFVSVPVEVPLVNGQATLNLEQTEGSKVSYLFEILQNTEVTETAEDGTITTKTVLVAVGEPFHAVVPDSGTPIRLTDLMPTGITRDALAAAIVTITRRLYNETMFWSALQEQIFRSKGEYQADRQYRLGDVVSYAGSSYFCRSAIAVSGVTPASPSTVWQLLAYKGDTGAGTTGVDLPYDATLWDGRIDAPSMNALRDIIETLARKTDIPSDRAPINSPSFSGLPTVPSPPAGNNSGLIANTGWVQGELAPLKNAPAPVTIPIGTIIAFAGTSIPAKWLRCDGSMIDKTKYAQLYSAIGNTYGAVDSDYAQYFRLPDLRGKTLIGRYYSETNQGTPSYGSYISDSWATTLGGVGGAATVTLTTNEMPAHNHIVEKCMQYQGSYGSNPYPTKAASSTTFYEYYDTLYYSDSSYGYWQQFINTLHYRTVNNGGGAAHNNVQPSIAINYIIYAGV